MKLADSAETDLELEGILQTPRLHETGDGYLLMRRADAESASVTYDIRVCGCLQ